MHNLQAIIALRHGSFMMSVDNQYKKIILTIIQRELPSCRVYLFGSRARRTNSPGSDIDIALDNGDKISPYSLSVIKEAIEESSIPFFVDVVDVHVVDPGLIEQIKKDGVLWN